MTRRMSECVVQNQPYLDDPLKVKRLQVQGPLGDFRPKDFLGLDNLEELYVTPDVDELKAAVRPAISPQRLRGSQSAEIFPGLFAGLPKLRRLHILMKGVTHLTAEAFTGLDQLSLLALSGNRIFKIEDGAFEPLRNLQTLLLDRNHLREVRASFFAPVPNLMDVDLSSNQIEKIEAGSFAHNHRLCRLNFEHNRLARIGSQAFLGLSQLASLHLGWNPLNASVARSFRCLGDGTQVSLERPGRRMPAEPLSAVELR